jgi:2,3-bisphosphoglycerate-dependent phosphoglycerate mutase
MREVWLIRHAESESNAGLPTSYPAASALTARGIEQARCIAAAFAEAPDLIVTSPYLRTKQTALATIERFPSVALEEWPVQEFSYLALVRDRLTTRVDRRPLAEAYWERCDPSYCDGPAAESFAQLFQRVATTVEQIRQQDARSIAIFTHGLFMRAVLWSLLSVSYDASAEGMRRFRAFRSALSVPNAAILQLRCEETIWIGGLLTSHLPASLLP